MPVVPISSRRTPAIPESMMPDRTHLDMAAAEYFQQFQREQAAMPEFQPSEPGEKFNQLKSKERKMEALQETAPESSLKGKPKDETM